MSSSLRVGTSLGGVGSGVGGKVGGKVGGGKVGGEGKVGGGKAGGEPQLIPHVQRDSQHVPAGQSGGAGGGCG